VRENGTEPYRRIARIDRDDVDDQRSVEGAQDVVGARDAGRDERRVGDALRSDGRERWRSRDR
jgi:hypothetical protein